MLQFMHSHLGMLHFKNTSAPTFKVRVKFEPKDSLAVTSIRGLVGVVTVYKVGTSGVPRALS
jgi:hypothetical protein